MPDAPRPTRNGFSLPPEVIRFAPYALIAGIILLFLHKLAFSNLILGRGDTFLYFYPYWHAAAERLRAGSIPLWNPALFMGAPFLANSQTGVLYPLNWPLWLLLPTPYAVSATILLHLMIAGWGTYRLGKRMLGLGNAAAFLAAVLFALGGYLTAQVEHVNQVQGLAWLPWVLWAGSCLEFRPSHGAMGRNHTSFIRRVLLLALFWALQLLAGHTQTAFITGVAVASMAGVAYLQLTIDDWRLTIGDGRLIASRIIQQVAPFILGALLAVGLAAAQLLPTLELIRLSSRQGGLPFNEAVSFSLHPLLLARALLPAYGQGLFTEYVAFLPLTALLLAFIGAWSWRRDRAVWPVLFLTGLGLFLALGRFNPAYWLIARVPGFDLFRVPARWLVLYGLGMALLAGVGWERVSSEQWRIKSDRWRKVLWSWGIVLVGLMVWGMVSVPLARFLPIGPEAPAAYPSWLTWSGWLVEGVVGSGLLVAGRRLTEYYLRVAVYCLLFSSLFLASRTLPYHAHVTTPEAFFDLRPPITRLLAENSPELGDASVYSPRFLSLSDIFFDVGDQAEIDSVYAGRLSELARFDYTVAIKQKEVVAPNLPLVVGLAAADGFDGGILPLQSYSQLTTLILPAGVVTTDGRLRENLDHVPPTRWLNLFNIGYVITDKVGDAWHEGVFFDLQHPVMLTAAAAVGYIPPYEATELWLVASSGDFWVDITTLSGRQWQLSPQPLSADLWQVVFPEPATATAISVRPTAILADSPPYLNGLSLVDSRDHSFQPLVLGAYRLIHSGDVKIYENLEVLPRAFLVYEWDIASDAAATLDLMRDPLFDPARRGVVEGEPLRVNREPVSVGADVTVEADVVMTSYAPERVEMRLDAAAPALLILTDSYYPGWQATLDGEAVTIYEADLLFRGVFVPEGEHQLVLRYEPVSWARGRVVSLITLIFWLSLVSVQLFRPAVKPPG